MLAATTAGDQSSARGLGVWSLAPVLALAALWVVILNTPSSNCDFDDEVPTYVAILVYGISAAASLGCAVGAVQRLAALWRRPGGFPMWELVAAALALLVLSMVDALLPIAAHTEPYWRLCVVFIPVTGLLLLVLLGAALLRREPEDVGLLLPAYLLGAAVFVYPSLAVVTLAVKNGALC